MSVPSWSLTPLLRSGRVGSCGSLPNDLQSTFKWLWPPKTERWPRLPLCAREAAQLELACPQGEKRGVRPGMEGQRWLLLCGHVSDVLNSMWVVRKATA